MKIFVEGKEAFLKKGTSFEFIAENRLFSGSDEYTLSITFPIVDCPRNRAIFGLLYRKDVDIEKVNFACELRGFSLLSRCRNPKSKGNSSME